MSANNVCVTVLLLLSVSACSSAPSEPEPQPADGVAAAPLVAAAPSGLRGYEHSAASSRFAIGTQREERLEHGMRKVIGSNGVFAVEARTKMVLGIPDASAPTRGRPPMLDPDAHAAAVRSYFVSAGLPEDQILEVRTQTTMQGGGPQTGEPLNPSMAKVQYYYGCLMRKTPSGIPIPDSVAYARINVDGDVVEEGVYWPDIPARALVDADGVRSTASSSANRAAYLGKIGQLSDTEPQNGHAVIRHTSGFWGGSFAAIASFDVPRKNAVVHFDGSGAVVDLPSERAGAFGPTPQYVK